MRIELPLETWMDVLDWLKRKEFAAKSDQLWDREFTGIGQFWLHEYQRNVQIGELWIQKGADGRAELRDEQNRIVPIANVDMPDNICGFNKIAFQFFDSTILEFLARMRPIFHNLSLMFDPSSNTYATLLLDRLQPLISGPIEWMDVDQELIPSFFDFFPAVLLNTKLLYIWQMSEYHVAELLVSWLLFNPRGDGQPRVLINEFVPIENFNHILAIVQQHFVDPQRVQASPFFIRVRVYNTAGYDELFEKESATEHGPTGEQLTIKKTVRDEQGKFYVLVSNCALDMDDDQKELEEKKVLDLRMHHVGMRKESIILFL